MVLIIREKMNIDIGTLKKGLYVANSTIQASALANEMECSQRLIDQINRQNAERNATLVAGAKANIAQRELFEQQIEMIQKQNDILFDNYTKLKELYDEQVNANKEAKEELKRSKRFNIAMMVIAIIAMIAAIAGPIATILVSQ